ncbi:MAG: hypothetical protein V1874_00565 [Spirochaetota bacterium]
MKKTAIILLFILFSASGLKAAEEELFFTYMGPVVGGGYNQVAYRGWSSETDTRISKVITGYFVSGGCLLNIYVRRFIGEFSLEYINNFSSGKPDVSVQHLIYNSTLKYSFPLFPEFAFTCGIGAYLETPPSDKSYNGGGLNGTTGLVFDISREWKLVFDVLARYGRFGMGDDSSKFSLGAKLGMVYKVGRI